LNITPLKRAFEKYKPRGYFWNFAVYFHDK